MKTTQAPAGSIISVNVGAVRNVEWEGHVNATGIFKNPVDGRVLVKALGLEGDTQADLSVHGGPQKAVYAYPSEHYEDWRKQLGKTLRWGAFGENLTTRGMIEDSVRIGDCITAGSAELVVTAPRFPCFKLGIKFGTMEMVKRFQENGWSGFYLAVSKEGDVAAGDPIRIIASDKSQPTIADIFKSEA
jgi:MOSC domain-containing protein YiiM